MYRFLPGLAAALKPSEVSDPAQKGPVGNSHPGFYFKLHFAVNGVPWRAEFGLESNYR